MDQRMLIIEKTKIFLFGLVAAIGIMVIMGAGPANLNGRYQGTTGRAGGENVLHFFLLDTQTGDVRVTVVGPDFYRPWKKMSNPFIESH